MRAPVALAALVLGACIEVPPASCPAGTDTDGDGWVCDGAVPDCDDGNEDIHPGALDGCDNDLDEDCSGADLRCTEALPGLTTEDEAAEKIVRGGGLTATFDGTLKWVLASLRTDEPGAELLSRISTSVEQYVGIELYPRFDQSEVTEAALDIVEAGPAYVRISIDWSNVGAGAIANGTSQFGFVPNGTIHRHELFNADAYTATPLWMATHWTLNAASFTHFVSRLFATPSPARPPPRCTRIPAAPMTESSVLTTSTPSSGWRWSGSPGRAPTAAAPSSATKPRSSAAWPSTTTGSGTAPDRSRPDRTRA